MSILDDPNILAKEIETKYTLGNYVKIAVHPSSVLYKDVFQKYWDLPIEYILSTIRQTPINEQWRKYARLLDRGSREYLREFNNGILKKIIEQTDLQAEFTEMPDPLGGYWTLKNDKSECRVTSIYNGWVFRFSKPKFPMISIQLIATPDYQNDIYNSLL